MGLIGLAADILMLDATAQLQGSLFWSQKRKLTHNIKTGGRTDMPDQYEHSLAKCF